jgi:flagella basal body P-ring formation protein FlgA
MAMLLLRPLLPVALAATFAAAPPVARAQEAAPSPTLRSEAVVDGDIVILGDLVRDCGGACAYPAFRAPAPGDTGVIQALRVLTAARDAGLRDVETGGVTQIVIARSGRAATREEIDGALALALAPRVAADAADLVITLDQPGVRLSLSPRAGEAPAVADLVIDPRARRFSASLAPGDSHSAQPVRVSGAYTETLLAPVLTRSVQRGDTVRIEDIALERRERATFGEDNPAAPQVIAGRVARASMRAGAILRERDLVKPILVERSAIVTLTFDSGALQLSLKGRATEQGSLGDVVGVQNLNSKRVVQGVVVGAGLVRLQTTGAGAFARTAAAQP